MIIDRTDNCGEKRSGQDHSLIGNRPPIDTADFEWVVARGVYLQDVVVQFRGIDTTDVVRPGRYTRSPK
jgi:hypothetical protein